MELHLKDYLTLGNAACGFLALALFPVFGFFSSFGLIVLAMVFDFFDGIVARKDNAHNEFGKQLDSLADAVSFGVAPAALVFFTLLPKDFYVFILLLLGGIFYLSAVVLRLAKYNLQSEKGVYYGLPSPLAAFLLLAFGWFNAWFSIALLFVLGILMTVRFKVRKVF